MTHIDELIDAKIVSGMQPLRGDIRQGIRELMEAHAKAEVNYFIGVMGKTGCSFKRKSSGWWMSDYMMLVAEQLTDDQLIEFLIDYDVNEG